MKKTLITLVAAVAAFAACKEDTIDTYDGANYIQFIEASADSTVVAFVFSPDKTELTVTLGMIMSGTPAGAERDYKVEVVPEKSTAVEGTHYTLPTRTSFKAGQVTSDDPITFKKTSEMLTKSFRLVLRVVPNGDFAVGEITHQTRTLVVHDMISKPDWWTATVQSTYFGKYSDQKFRLMIEQLGTGDLSEANDSEMRAYAIKFKYWLLRQSPAIFDDANGEVMSVTVKG